MINRVKRIIKGLAAYLAFVSVFQFSNFILEESIQCVQFGTWQLKDNPRMLKTGVQLMEAINYKLWIINNLGGWLNPLGWISYNEYHNATNYWIATTKARILAQDPEAMLGEDLEVTFTPTLIENHEDKTIAKAGHLRMVLAPGASMPIAPQSVTVRKTGENIELVPRKEAK